MSSFLNSSLIETITNLDSPLTASVIVTLTLLAMLLFRGMISEDTHPGLAVFKRILRVVLLPLYIIFLSSLVMQVLESVSYG